MLTLRIFLIRSFYDKRLVSQNGLRDINNVQSA